MVLTASLSLQICNISHFASLTAGHQILPASLFQSIQIQLLFAYDNVMSQIQLKGPPLKIRVSVSKEKMCSFSSECENKSLCTVNPSVQLQEQQDKHIVDWRRTLSSSALTANNKKQD